MTRILIKAPNWVGDCVMATPAIHLVRQALPDAAIDILARPSVAQVFADNADKSALIIADDRDMDRKVTRQLQANQYDAAMLLPNSFGSAWLAWKLGIPVRVGYSRNKRGLLLTHPIAYDPYDWQTPTPEPLSRKSIKPRADKLGPGPFPGDRPHHMVDYYGAVAMWTLEALGYEPPGSKTFEPNRLLFELGADAISRVDELITAAGIQDKVLIGLNPGAAYGSAKRWPLDRLAAAADALATKYSAEIVSTAYTGEAHLTDEVQKHCTAQIHRLGEEVDLRGLAALISRFSVLITNDSGAMHIAAARRIPIVAIFGPMDWNVTNPYGASGEVVRQSPPCAPCFLRECPIDHRCMLDVQVEDVIQEADRQLGRRAA